jgi:hypothetical protein
MNIIPIILGGGGAIGGIIGAATGAGEAFGDALRNGRTRSFYDEINSLESTIELAKDTSAIVWKPVLYGGIGMMIGVTFPISLPIAHTMYEKFKTEKEKERQKNSNLWNEVLKSED